MPQLPPQLPIWGRRALARIAQNTLWLLSAVAALLFVTQIVVAIAKGNVATQIKRWEEKNNALANKVQQLAITYPQWAATNSFNNSINSAASPFRPADPALGKHLSSFSLKGTPFPDRQHFAVAASSTEDCMKQLDYPVISSMSPQVSDTTALAADGRAERWRATRCSSRRG